MSEPISVRARVDRFPATVKGAFVIRGEDSDPHQVVLRGARVVPMGRSGGRALELPEATLNVAPHRDLFVPFELSVVDLEPGWYGLECTVDVDGRSRTFPGGRRFVVAWPRSAVRRGHVSVGRTLSVPDGPEVRVEQVDCGPDSIRIRLVASPPDEVVVRLEADGERLEVLESVFDPETGEGTVRAYPLLRAHGVLRIEVGRGRRRAGLDVPLP